MPLSIICINRLPVTPADCDLGTIDLTNLISLDPTQILKNIDAAERILDRLKDWMKEHEPALLGVEPEKPIYLYVFDQSGATSWRVTPVEWTQPSDLLLAEENNIANPKNLIFTIKVRFQVLGIVKTLPVQFSIHEIKALTPDMSILEGSKNYKRNGLVMAMSVKVINSLDEESAPWLPFPVWLPPPLVGQFVWKKGQNQVTAGFLEAPVNLSPEQYSNYLGKRAIRDSISDVNAKYGQVRWYSLNNFPQLGFLQLNPSNPVNPAAQPSPCIPLPNIVAGKLADLRRAGRWLYNEVGHWDDDCVIFTTPPEAGAAVIWRDDLPSKPIACFDLLKYAGKLAERLWRPVLSSGELDIDIPIPAGKLIQLSVARLESAANNELAKFIGSGLSVRFAFLARGLQDDPNDPSSFDEKNFVDKSPPCIGSDLDKLTFQDKLEPGDTGVSKDTVGFRYRPQITAADLSDAQAGAFGLQLYVILNGTVTLLGSEVKIDNEQLAVGPELRFHPQPVKIPDIWQPVLGNGTLDLDIPIPAGEIIKLKVERLEDTANNALTQFIGNKIKVRFAFLTKALTQNQGEASKYDDTNFAYKSLPCIGSDLNKLIFQDKFEPGQTGISSEMLEFRYKPQASSTDLTDAEAGAFTLQLNITFEKSTVNLLGYDLEIPEMHFPIGPVLHFHPVPVKLPTMAIFFEHPNFTGAALVALPSGTGLFDNGEIHIDANTPDSYNLKRVEIINELSRIKDMLGVVQFFWPNQVLDVVKQVVSEICSLGRSVIDSKGKIENTSDCVIEKRWYGDANFNDAISSVVLVGPPHSYTTTVVKCWEHSLRRADQGRCLRLMIPDNKFIAGIPDLRFLFNDFFPLMNIHVPQPYGTKPGDVPLFAGNSFNDIITGIEIVTE
jgi:hypothetical protein